MRENKVYTIVRVCSKLINHTTSTRDSCLHDLLLPTPDRFYSAQILKNLLILPNEVFFIKSFKRKKIPHGSCRSLVNNIVGRAIRNNKLRRF